MSFIRPELTRAAAQWWETAAWGAGTVALAVWAARAGADVYWSVGLVLAVAAIGFWLTRAAWLSARAASNRRGPGVVLIDERRITYLGPENGGFASINAIDLIEVVPADPAAWRQQTRWILRAEDDDGALEIPAGAEGAAGLIDAFSALPGFEPARALEALNGPAGRAALIWRRREGASLVSPAGRA